MKGSSLLKKLLYISLWGSLMGQILALSLFFSWSRGWLSPMVFRLSQYYLSSLGIQLLEGDLQLKPGGLASMRHAVAYIGTDPAIGPDSEGVLSLQEGSLDLSKLPHFWLKGGRLELQLQGLSIRNTAEEKPIFCLEDLSCTLDKEGYTIKRGSVICGPIRFSVGGSASLASLRQLVAKLVASKDTQETEEAPTTLQLAPTIPYLERFERDLAAFQDPLGSIYFQEKGETTRVHLYVGVAWPQGAYVQGLLEFSPRGPLQVKAHLYIPSLAFTSSLAESYRCEAKAVLGAMAMPDLAHRHTLELSLAGKACSLNSGPSLSFLRGDFSLKENLSLKKEVKLSKDLRPKEDIQPNRGTKPNGAIKPKENLSLKEDLRLAESIGPKENTKPNKDLRPKEDIQLSRDLKPKEDIQPKGGLRSKTNSATPGHSKQSGSRLLVTAVDGGSWALAWLDWHLQQENLCLKAKGELQASVLQHPWLKAYVQEGSYLHQPLRLYLQGRWGAACALQELSGTIYGDDICLLGIPLDSLHARLRLDPTTLAFTQIAFRHAECRGEGRYDQSLETSDYRFLLNGSLNPHLLTPIMDPWWKDLWADFELPSAWPEADVDVGGNWKEQSTSFVYGYAKAQDFAFRKAPVEEGSLYFWAAPLYLQLFDLSLSYQGEDARARIDWVYTPEEPDNYYGIAFEAESSRSLSHLALLLGSKDVENISKSFHLDPPPHLGGRGILYGRAAHLRQDHLRLRCEALHSLSYEGLHLDYMSFDFHKQGAKTDISSLEFGLAGGRAHGALSFNSLDNPAARPALAFDLSLEDGSYDALRELARYQEQFRASAEGEARDATRGLALPKKRVEAAPVGGFASIKAKGSGQLGSFNSFMVEGTFRLSEAQLGQIHLLGQFSKTLRLGSFDFKNLRADFDLNGGLLKVPTLSIWGNTARMEGKGEYSLVRDELNFFLHFYLLGGLKLPVVSHVFQWIDPLSKVSFIELKGSLEEPEWKLKLSPFAFLK